jgi:hypothetical protein
MSGATGDPIRQKTMRAATRDLRRAFEVSMVIVLVELGRSDASIRGDAMLAQGTEPGSGQDLPPLENESTPPETMG